MALISKVHLDPKHQLYRSRLPYFYLIKVGKSTDERQPINFVDPSTPAINFRPACNNTS